MSQAEIVKAVTDSGLRGRGGAGFPTGIKWNTVMQAKADEKFVCCNADEGDSGTFADRMIIEGDPFCLIEGMTIAAIAVGATSGYVYMRSEYPHATATLRHAIKLAYDEGWLGDNIHGTNRTFHLDVRVGAGAYICGEETAMLESLEGKRGMVRAKPPLPALEGLFGKPTVVNNVLSLCSVPIILDKGGEYYRDFGVGRSRGTLPFQLAGNIKNGGIVEKAFGITLHELLYEYGGGTITGRPIRAVQVGGPLGAYLPPSQFDLPKDYEAFAAQEAMVGHGGIVVFDDSVDMAQQARFAMEFCVAEFLRQVHPLPHRLDPRDGDAGQDHRRQERRCELGPARRPLRRDGGWLALRHGRHDALSGAQRGEALPGRLPQEAARRPRHPHRRRITSDPRSTRDDPHPRDRLRHPARVSETLVTLEIDGRAITVPEGTSVMRAAMDAGITVPKLCATDSLEPFGSCRLCAVEIEGRRGTPASCTTPVAPGMRSTPRPTSWPSCAAA